MTTNHHPVMAYLVRVAVDDERRIEEILKAAEKWPSRIVISYRTSDGTYVNWHPSWFRRIIQKFRLLIQKPTE